MCNVPAVPAAGMVPVAKQAYDGQPPSTAELLAATGSSPCARAATSFGGPVMEPGANQVADLGNQLAAGLAQLQAMGLDLGDIAGGGTPAAGTAAGPDTASTTDPGAIEAHPARRTPIPLESLPAGTDPVIYDPFVQELQAATRNGDFVPWTPSY